MSKCIKQLLWFFIQQAEITKAERVFCVLMTQKIFPLLRKMYPNVCVRKCYPVMCKLYPNTCTKDESPCFVQRVNFEESERVLKVLYFGGDFFYWQIQQFPLLYLRTTTSYKERARLDEINILYQWLYMFEEMWNNEFRDFLRKKVPYSANPKHQVLQHQNKPKPVLSHADEMRDLELINLRLEQHQVNVLREKTQFVVDFAAFSTRGQLPAQVSVEYDKLFFGNDELVLFSSADPSNVGLLDDNIWYIEKLTNMGILSKCRFTFCHSRLSGIFCSRFNRFCYTKQKLLDYTIAIICADREFTLCDQPAYIEPLSVELVTDETEAGIEPKTLYMLVDWGHGIIERFILWHNDKTNVDYLSYLLEYLLQQGDTVLSAKKPKDYKNFGKYLKRLGLELILQRVFCITQKTRYPKVGRSKVFIRELSLSDKAELFELLPNLPFYDWVDDLADIEIQQDQVMESLLLHIPEPTSVIKY